MTIVWNELRIHRYLLVGWTLALAAMMALCILIYPQIGSQEASIGEMFSSMGTFSTAFGLDQLNFGQYAGYFGIECGNVMGLGGGLFAAVLGISMTSREEEHHTAAFYLAAPISRMSFYLQKCIALMLMILLMNLAVWIVVAAGSGMIDEEVTGNMMRVMAANLWMQVDVGMVGLGLSTFLRRTSLALGLCLALGMYFLHLIGNLMPDGGWIQYVTPYGFTDAAWIDVHARLDWGLIASNTLLALLVLGLGGWWYRRKDLAG